MAVAAPKPFVFRPRSAQLELERGIELHRVVGLIARRQFGKTTGAARIALKKMMRTAGHDVVFGSVKLDLGREIVRKESAALRAAIAQMSSVASGEHLLQVTNAQTGQALPANIGIDDFDGVYEACRLELRLYHSRTIYSRTKVVALTPDAVGETGDLILDEVGRVKNFQDVWEAVHPIISSNPKFRCLLTTTPPPDDSHYSFELLAPPIDSDFKPDKNGNWYRSEHGVHVLRVDAWDAYADGVVLYDDDTGTPITPEESRARAHDKDAWDRNYGCLFVFGGTAACGFVELDTAMRRGIGQCAFFMVETDLDFDRALAFVLAKVGSGPIGLGWDLATTEHQTSNPSSFTILEQRGVDLVAVGVIAWKTKEPRIARERSIQIVKTIKARKDGGRARRLCIDATNERYFATEMRTHLGSEIPVELVIGSETISVPGRDEPITMKQFLGDMLVGELNDNHLTLPPERYIKDDFRLPRKERGQFVCLPAPDGKHGDTFDSTKLSLRALRSTSGAVTSVAGIKLGKGVGGRAFRPRKLPRGGAS